MAFLIPGIYRLEPIVVISTYTYYDESCQEILHTINIYGIIKNEHAAQCM